MSQSFLGRVVFRPARKDECRTIARLYSISSDGLADYIWTTIARPGEGILDVGENGIQTKTFFSVTKTAWSPSLRARS